jgi:hypothetical protein
MRPNPQFPVDNSSIRECERNNLVYTGLENGENFVSVGVTGTRSVMFSSSKLVHIKIVLKN